MTDEAPSPREAVRLVLESARVVEPAVRDGAPVDPTVPATAYLPDGCPVTPLGVLDGTSWYLDAVGQIRGLTASQHGRSGLVQLFAPRVDWLYEHFARQGARGKITGIRAEVAAEGLMAAAAARGVWDPIQHVRGAGAWRGDDGALIYHCGDCLVIHGHTRGTGALDGHVYARCPPGPRPLACPPGDPRITGGPEGAAGRLEALLHAWHWQVPYAPRLLLGWIGAAILGGALDYRPLVWLSGDKGTGKSTLQGLIASVLGNAVKSSDASAAGIWQQVGHSAVPVAIDELEPDADRQHAQQVVRLARQAATGGLVLRGGADHQAAQFQARNAFLFSSILVPPLTPADRSRIIVLALETRPGGRPPSLTPKAARDLGAALRRRLADLWAHWPARLEAWQAALVDIGHSGRGADAWGTPLAVADLLLADEMPTADDFELIIGQLAPASVSEDDSDAADCLDHLLTSSPPAYRQGVQHTIGHWIRQARLYGDSAESDAVPILGTIGLRLVDGPDYGGPYLAVANKHQGLAKVFADQRWAGGVWSQAVRRLPGAKPWGTMRIGGVGSRCTLLPLALVLAGDGP